MSDAVRNGDAYTYDEAVELTGHGRYNYLLLAVCSIISNAFALDMFGYATVVAASTCDLNIGLKQVGVLASAPFAGVLFAFPWGYYADTHGRRQALLVSTAVGFLLASISSFSPSWQFMLIVKTIGSSFSTASFTLSMTIVGECTIARHRSQYMQILNSFNLASEFVGFGLAYFILSKDFNIPLPWFGITYRPWRLLTFILALPLGIGATFMFLLLESPKFLASQGHHHKALEVLERIYKINGGKKDGYPVKCILLTESDTKIHSTFWRSIAEHTVPIFKPPLLWRTIQLFFLLALCCSTNNIFAMWYPTMVNFFFKSFNEEHTNTTSANFCQRISSQTLDPQDIESYTCNDTISMYTIYSGMLCGLFFFITNLVVSTFASRTRLVLIGTLVVSGVSSSLVNLKDPVANMVFFTLVQFTAVGIGCVATYFVDMYPTCHRGLVTSLGMMVARMMSFLGINVIGILVMSHCELTFYCMSLLALSGIVVALFLPADRKSVR
nr:putative transporter svop-1 [Helicoverpa armigera]